MDVDTVKHNKKKTTYDTGAPSVPLQQLSKTKVN